jgi:nucleolar complex protein 2
LNVTYTPRNRTEVDTFLKDVDWESTPLGAFVKTQRKLREERAAILEEGRLEEEKRRAEAKSGNDELMNDFGSDDGSDDEEGEEELESENEEEDEDEEEDEVEMEDE